VSDDHFEVRVTHLMRDVLRIFSARKLQRGVAVPAMIDSAVPQRSLHENSLPVSISEVREIDRAANIIQENELAAHLRARSLLLQLIDNQREHVHFTLARCDLREPDSGEPMDAAANS
jgi:hypothetical protein